jgi:hypothetical protein
LPLLQEVTANFLRKKSGGEQPQIARPCSPPVFIDDEKKLFG